MGQKQSTTGNDALKTEGSGLRAQGIDVMLAAAVHRLVPCQPGVEFPNYHPFVKYRQVDDCESLGFAERYAKVVNRP